MVYDAGDLDTLDRSRAVCEGSLAQVRLHPRPTLRSGDAGSGGGSAVDHRRDPTHCSCAFGV